MTTATIQENKGSKSLQLNLSWDEKNAPSEAPYLLIIESRMQTSLRVTIYPIKLKRLVKVSISGIKDLSEKNMAKLSQVFQEHEVIHTSGFIKSGAQFRYECYLGMSPEDPKLKELKRSLDRFANIFKIIKIETIESTTS
jgi:hypothetical protein